MRNPYDNINQECLNSDKQQSSDYWWFNKTKLFTFKNVTFLQVLQTTKASSVSSDFRIGDIFNRFYGELCHKSKLPDSGESEFSFAIEGIQKSNLCPFFALSALVLGKIYELLGVLAEVHPSEMVNHSDKLFKAILGELKEQVCEADWRCSCC